MKRAGEKIFFLIKIGEILNFFNVFSHSILFNRKHRVYIDCLLSQNNDYTHNFKRKKQKLRGCLKTIQLKNECKQEV